MGEALNPENDPAQTAQKPAIKTLEGQVSTGIAIMGAVLLALEALHEQGIFGDGKIGAIIGAVLAVAASFGLLASRTILKMNGNKAAALVAAAKAAPPSDPL
jgi:hypothetical protein